MNTNPFDLSGHHAFVTGGSRGIGLGIARSLAEAGARLTLFGRNNASLGAARDQLHGKDHGVVVGDICELEQIPSYLQQAAAERDELDILVNCAGDIRRGPAETLPIQDFEYVMRANVSASFAFAQSFAQRRIAVGGNGSIINIASLMSEASRRNTAAYTASKGAVKMLTRNLAVEWAQFGITVNAIGPGFIRTDFTDALQQNTEFDGWVRERTPLGRWGETKDIGPTAVFLSSSASRFITGQIIYADGGVLASL